MSVEEFKASLKNEGPPGDIAVALQALWWDAKGQWAKAHDLVNELETQEGMAVHAYLHRKEGNQENSEYWYKRVGRGYFREEFKAEWEALVEALLARR